jgi:small subunit ribosomal protein S15
MIAFVNNINLVKKNEFNVKSVRGVSALKAQISAPQPYINSKQLKEVREKYRLHEKDTGSAEYQIAALSVRIAYMTAHVKKNPKDFSSTRGLIAMVSARKKLLKYLRRQSKERFLNICVNLKIRIQKDAQ